MLSCCTCRGREPEDDPPKPPRSTSLSTLNEAVGQKRSQEESLELEWVIVEESITEDEFERLCALRSAVQDLNGHPACSKRPLNQQGQTLLRFLRGREGNVEAAEKMFRDTLDWRASMDIDKTIEAWGDEIRRRTTVRAQLVTQFSTDALIGPDQYGVPIWLMRMGVSDPAGMLRELGPEALLVHSLYTMETMHRALRVAMFRQLKVIRGCIQIVDVGDYGRYGVENWWGRMWDGYTVGKDAFKVFDQNYPETTRKVFIVRMGAVTYTIHRWCQPLIPPRTQRKMRVFGYSAASWREELKSEMATTNSRLPGFLICDDEQAFALASPRGGMVPVGYNLQVDGENSSRTSVEEVRRPLFSNPKLAYFFALVMVLALAIVIPALFRVDSSQTS